MPKLEKVITDGMFAMSNKIIVLGGMWLNNFVTALSDGHQKRPVGFERFCRDDPETALRTFKETEVLPFVVNVSVTLATEASVNAVGARIACQMHTHRVATRPTTKLIPPRS